MNNNKILQIIFWLLSAMLVGYVSLTYIPYSVELLAIDRATLREIVPSREVCSIWADGEESLTVSILPDTAITELSWSSDDESIATVDNDGKVTATGLGSTTLTVTDGKGVEAKIEVNVIDKVLPPDSTLPENYSDRLIIANVDNNIGKDYIPELVTVPAKFPTGHVNMKMTTETMEAYERMYDDCMKATGVGFNLLSSYRSYEKQQQLFDEDVASYRAKGYSHDQAVKLTAESTQYPGCSEHQLGESVDIGNTLALNSRFYTTRAGAWVTEHAHEYGFVLRYPKDKVDITKISYEAWHFRYVGVEHAPYIYENGLCVEEYVALQDQAAAAAEEYCKNVSAQEYLDSLNA